SATVPVAAQPAILRELQARFPALPLAPQATADGIPTAWVPEASIKHVLAYLKREAPRPFAMLYDLGAIDERARVHRDGPPATGFTVYYHLLSYERNADVRLKVAVSDSEGVASITDLWPAAAWYEREVWDMFGIAVRGHPNLRRILLPDWWEG